MKKLISILLIFFSLTMLFSNASMAGVGEGPNFGEIALFALGATIIASIVLALANWGISNYQITKNEYLNPSWLSDGRIICTKVNDIYIYDILQQGDNKTKKIRKVYTLTVMNADGTEEKDVREIDEACLGGELASSPDGKYIAITSGASIKVFKSDFSDYSTITPNNSKKSIPPDISPVYYGNGIVHANSDKVLSLTNISSTSDTLLASTPSNGAKINSLDFSPEYYGYKIVYTNSDKELRITNISSSFDTLLASSAESVTWSVGDKIVYSSNTSGFIVLNSDGLYLCTLASSDDSHRNISDDYQITNDHGLVYLGKDRKVHSMKLDGSSVANLIPDYQLSSFKLSYNNNKILGSLISNDGFPPQIYVTDIPSGTTLKLR